MKAIPEWQTYLKQNLRGTGLGKVRLICDGDRITFQESINQRRVVIMWFFNGQWKGEYYDSDNEIGKKYGAPIYIKTKRSVVDLARRCYGDQAAELAKNQKNLIGYNYKYTSPTAIICKLKETCKEIQVWTESKIIESPEDIQL